jgi:hypothetical protein
MRVEVARRISMKMWWFVSSDWGLLCEACGKLVT